MSTYTSLSALFQAICNSVRKKEGTSSLINHQDIPNRILALNGSSSGAADKAIYTFDIETASFTCADVGIQEFQYIDQSKITEIEEDAE